MAEMISIDTSCKTRLALIHTLNLNLRLMETWREAQAELTGSALSSDCTMILMAIIAIKTERVVRTGELEGLEDLLTPIDTGTLRRCNLTSIAATTGLQRETVRRKIAYLESLDFVRREVNGGVTLVDGLLQRPEVLRCVERQIAIISGACRQMRKDGILSASIVSLDSHRPT